MASPRVINKKEWLTISEYVKVSDLSNRDYIYRLVKGKKQMIKNRNGEITEKWLPPKMKKGRHFIVDNNKTIRIHKTVKIENGIITGGKRD